MSKKDWSRKLEEKQTDFSSGDQSPQLCMTPGLRVSLVSFSPPSSSRWIWNRSSPPVSTPQAMVSLVFA